MQDYISISSGGISADINLMGAELISLKDKNHQEIMSDGDPAFWSGRAPFLFPIVGQLKDDQYRLNGQSYTMQKHGFARKNIFTLREQSENRAVLTLCANESIKEQYPFDFKLKAVFELFDEALHMTMEVSNKGDVDMPFSFGFHPAFAWPLPFGGDVKDHRIIFEQNEPAPVRRLLDGLVKPMSHQSPVKNNIFAPNYDDFEADAIIWDDLNSSRLTWGVDGRTHLDIEFPDTQWLGIWQKPRAKFLCIEPWAGMADPVGFDGDFTQKPGVMMLSPDESRSFRMNVRLKEN